MNSTAKMFQTFFPKNWKLLCETLQDLDWCIAGGYVSSEKSRVCAFTDVDIFVVSDKPLVYLLSKYGWEFEDYSYDISENVEMKISCFNNDHSIFHLIVVQDLPSTQEIVMCSCTGECLPITSKFTKNSKRRHRVNSYFNINEPQQIVEKIY